MANTIKGNDVLNPEFFEDDLQMFNIHLEKNEDLYEEVHEIFEQATGGEGATFKNMRDVSEIAKTLSSIRSTSIDGVNKRFQMKRSVADLELKKKQGDNDNQNAAEIARATVMAIRSDVALSKPIEVSRSKEAISKAKLKERFTQELDKTITLTDNDRAMKYAFKGVEFVYNKTQKKVVAYSKDGEALSTYPSERIPDTKIVREDNGYAITANGIKYRIV